MNDGTGAARGRNRGTAGRQAGRASKPQVTIYDVARDAGVSFGTVSRVLNGRRDVSEKTRARVLESIQRLNYVSHPFARGLARRSTGLVGFVSGGARSSGDRHSYYALEMQQGVLRGAGDAGYNVVILDPENAHPKTIESFSRLVEGVIVRGNMPDVLKEQLDPKVPVVGINSPNVQPSVRVDHESGAREAVLHLVELGHRRIALVPGTGRGASSARLAREAAYRSVLDQCNLAYDPALHSDSIDINKPHKLHRVLDGFLSLDDPPTAIFVGGDTLALETINYLAERGIRVPGDISIVGSSDLPIGALALPSLSTVHIPLAKMAEQAAEMLAELIRDPSTAIADESFTTRLIVRGSSGPPSGCRKEASP